MPKFPVDTPKAKVIKALQALGFAIIREGNHISMARPNADGTTTPLTMPNHPHIHTICRQANILRADFMQAYENL